MRKLSSLLLFCLGLLAAGSSFAGGELKPWTGGPTPPLVLTDMSGKQVDLAALKGKVVLINFWATWCAPCIAELPSMEKMRDKIALAGFEAYAVNYQETVAKINDFLRKRPLKLPILRDHDGTVRAAWNVRTFPTSFIIDTDGRIRYWVIGDVDWTSPSVEGRIRELLPKT